MSDIAANLQQYLSAGSLLAYPAAFLAGLLISFTPCVYPIIPIQLGFIGGRVAAANTEGIGSRGANGRGFKLSVLFVTGMALVYAALGAFASLTGTLFGIWAASPWTYVIVGNIVLLLALSMLDVFTLPTPQFLTKWNPERKGNGYVAALLVGASSGLVVGPCTAPALGAALAYVGAQGSVVFGTTILFTFAFGMGALMIVLGTFGGALLPRSGMWMIKVKKAFGVVMIVVAEYMLLEAGKRLI
ncbi:MAG: sulfite exporter TauE/SafE family protein [Pyrinomonadaceae bacterium]|jgi:thiol:disulfide interchange protein DsbD|nr:sulfite exporter TauE/SafE family protein [Pyrinomonadaceae bacterium]